MSARHARRLAGVVSLVWLAACSDAMGPGVEPEIRNIADNFEFQVSQLSNYSGVLEYTWSNSGTQANVNQATELSAGSAHLRLLSPQGNLLYSRELAENGTFGTESAEPGSWRVRVEFTGASGHINFRVQKRLVQ